MRENVVHASRMNEYNFKYGCGLPVPKCEWYL